MSDQGVICERATCAATGDCGCSDGGSIAAERLWKNAREPRICTCVEVSSSGTLKRIMQHGVCPAHGVRDDADIRVPDVVDLDGPCIITIYTGVDR